MSNRIICIKYYRILKYYLNRKVLHQLIFDRIKISNTHISNQIHLLSLIITKFGVGAIFLFSCEDSDHHSISSCTLSQLYSGYKTNVTICSGLKERSHIRVRRRVRRAADAEMISVNIVIV